MYPIPLHPACIAAGLVAVCASAMVAAQTAPTPPAPAVTSKPVLVAPMSGVEGKELVMLAVHLPRGSATSVHTHPGDCMGTVLEGDVELHVEGQAPRRYAAGDTYLNLRGTVHQFRNVGGGDAKLLNSLAVDKGAPRSQPVAGERKP